MSPHNKKAFVRAKPTKIVIEELYQYKANVQENLALSFEKDKSRGTIKVEFVYDGEHLSSGWERAVLWRGLQNKWKLPGQIRNRIRKHMKAWREKRFVGPAVGGVCWLLGGIWHIIWWLPGCLIRQYLKLDLRPDASKSFGAPALADVEKYGAGPTKALAGYLALRGYNKPAFDEDWPERCTLPLEIPVDDLESKMSNGHKYIIKRPYSPQKPPKEPVRLGSVSLCDEVPHDKRSNRNTRLGEDARGGRIDTGEMLWLEIPLIVDIEPPDLDEKNQLKLDMARDLWEKGRRWEEGQEKRATDQENEEEKKQEPPFADQLDFFPEEERDRSAISEALSRLSRRRGGYLFFAINSEKDEKALEKLQEEMLDITLKECSPPVPIMKPYALGRRGEQQLAIVPVPRRVRHSSGHRPGLIQVEGRFTYEGINVAESYVNARDRIEISWWELASRPDSMAQALVATANSDDGCVTVEIGPIDSYDKMQEASQLTRGSIIEQAKNCNPPMRPYISPRQLVDGKAVLIVIPPFRSPYPFTHQGKAWTLRGGKIEETETDDIYELFKERNEFHYPTLVTPPIVTYASLEWPHMDYRDRRGIRHDPDNRALEWASKETMQQTSHDVFETTLAVQIMHPIELYQMGHVNGQIRVQFDGWVLSGLDVEYFDAIGQRHPYGNEPNPEMVKSTTVVINLDIVPNAIFERRPFYPYRRLEFEGVKADPDRLNDIISLLADLGLEDIDTQSFFYFGHPVTLEEAISIGGVMITGHSRKRNLKVQLRIEGSPQTIRRRRKNGERIDQMQVPTGQLRITLRGEIKGESPLELSRSLNQIQHLLKERLSFVRVHLK